MLKYTSGPTISMHMAVAFGDYEALHTLLRSGVDPNGKNKFEETPLHAALKEDVFSANLQKKT